MYELGLIIVFGGFFWYNYYVYLFLKFFSKSDIEGYFFNCDSYFFILDVLKEEVLKMIGGYLVLF